MRPAGLWLLVPLLLFSPSLWSQSFEDSAVYEVTGAELNQLEMDLLTAKSELTKSKQDLEKSKAELKESKAELTLLQGQLTELQTQLTTVSRSWNESKSVDLRDKILVGALSFVVGAILWEVVR